MQDQALDNDEIDVDEEEVSFFTDIDELQAHGINAADIKKLKASGICTLKGVQMTTRRKLCAIKGLSEAKVDKIKEASGSLGNYHLVNVYLVPNCKFLSVCIFTN